MGTRGAFGVIIGEQEKIGYNQYDSYPSGKGQEILDWLRLVMREKDGLYRLDDLATKCKVVSDEKKPTKRDIEKLAPYTNLSVSEQSTKDWYCLTRGTHGNLQAMLDCGYILDSSEFPLDSLFCEWAYIVDLDRTVFEVYEGFQKTLPTAGRWAGRPTAEEDLENFKEHLLHCYRSGREPYREETPDYKAVELVGSYPLSNLPSDEEFLLLERREEEVEA